MLSSVHSNLMLAQGTSGLLPQPGRYATRMKLLTTHTNASLLNVYDCNSQFPY